MVQAIDATVGESTLPHMSADKSATDPTPPPKRRFWQFHLSTAITMMIVSSVMLYLDVWWFEAISEWEETGEPPFGPAPIQGPGVRALLIVFSFICVAVTAYICEKRIRRKSKV